MRGRLAIGASRGRLLKEILAEGLILSALGTAGGFLMAYWCRHLLVMLLPVREGDAMYLPGAIDGRVMAMSVGICLVVTLIIGLVPAFQTYHRYLPGPLTSHSAGCVGLPSPYSF